MKLQQKQNTAIWGLLVLFFLFSIISSAQTIPNNSNTPILNTNAVRGLTEVTPSQLEALINLQNSNSIKEEVNYHLQTVENYVDYKYSTTKGLFKHWIIFREYKKYDKRQQQWVTTNVKMFICGLMGCDDFEFIGFQKLDGKVVYSFRMHNYPLNTLHFIISRKLNYLTSNKVVSDEAINFKMVFSENFDFKAFVAALNNESADKLQAIVTNNNLEQIVTIFPENYYEAVKGFIFNQYQQLTVVKEVVEELGGEEGLTIEDLQKYSDCINPTEVLTKLAEKEFCAFSDVTETEYDNFKEVSVTLTIDEETCIEQVKDYEIDFTGNVIVNYTLTKRDNGEENSDSEEQWCFEKITSVTIENEKGSFTFTYEENTLTLTFDYITENPADEGASEVRNTGFVSVNYKERITYFSVTVSDAETNEFLYKVYCNEDDPLYFEEIEKEEGETLEKTDFIPSTGKIYLDTPEKTLYETRTTKVTVQNFASLDFDTGNIETAELYVKTIVKTTVRGRTTEEVNEETKEINVVSGLNEIIELLLEALNQ